MNYLLFHTLVEFFSIVIAYSIFIIAWNSKKYIANNYLLWIGIAYFFISGLDLLHTLSYTGMAIFTDYPFYANQLWIAARYTESITFLLAGIFIIKNWPFSATKAFFVYLFLFTIIIASVFWWKVFPVCYVEGEGQTIFKIVSEYIIIIILGLNIYLLYRHKRKFDPRVYLWIIFSLVFTVFSEFSFTLYFNNYGFTNFLGHVFKLASFFLIYKAIVVTGFKNPMTILFRELKQNEQELKELNFTKDRFFSIIAHDLKSPFNTLMGFSELLLNNRNKLSQEEMEKMLNLINQSAQRTGNLLENLLEWSRTQTGRLQTQPELFDIREIILENIDLLNQPALEKNINLFSIIDEPKQVYSDKNMVRTVLRNLISNAIKFTYPNGKVYVETNEISNYTLEVKVIDNGRGIDQEQQRKIFQFGEKKISSLGTAQEKGTGLGLIICKEFIQANHGMIKVESQPGEGTTFIFTLPRTKSEGSDQEVNHPK